MKNVMEVLGGKALNVPPLWLMRQAGRYLPEYRAVRAKAGSFWKMALTPVYAAEVTLQPVRRFDFDAAILFSDILVVPEALGCKVSFVEGEGPRMEPVTAITGFQRDRRQWGMYLAPVYEALSLTRAGLAQDKTLLGFAGAPWTLASYLAAGRGGDAQKAAKLWGYRDPEGFAQLLNVLAECVAFHLVQQLGAGADAVQIFDSWAGGLPAQDFEQWVIAPTEKVVRLIRDVHPEAKIIGFPRAATLHGYEIYAQKTGVDAISLDSSAPMAWAAQTLGKQVVVQGNLDPVALVAGGDALGRNVDSIRAAMRDVPFIFNLGHGILPETPLSNVEALVASVRA